jgi:hypothetical protein
MAPTSAPARRSRLHARGPRLVAALVVLALATVRADELIASTPEPAAAQTAPVPLPVSADPGIELAGAGAGAGSSSVDQHPERLSTTPASAGTDTHVHESAGTGIAGAALPGTVADSWSSVSTFRTSDGWYASPIHATLLTDGRIFFVGIARAAEPPTATTPFRKIAWVFTPPALGQPVPATTTITEITEPVELQSVELGTVWYVNDDFYCMGATLTHDGRVVTAGGTRTVKVLETGVQHTLGLPYETVFDGTNWVRQPGTMLGTGVFGQPTRWYPTLTRLPDRRTLVTGGLEIIVGPDNIGFSNRSVETYDTDSGERTMFSTMDETPASIQARDYSHVFVLPYATAPYDVLVFGEAAVPTLGRTTEPGTWTTSTGRPGDGGATTNWGTSSAMLPIRVPNGEWGYVNGAVLMAGGDMHTPFERRVDVWDPLFGWRPSIDLGAPRHHPSTVVLPDSRTLIVNGHDMDNGGVSVQQAQYIDPADGFSLENGVAQSGVTRGYHSVALLLPDGRVLVAGGRDRDTKTSLEKPTFQIYSPDYLNRTRPTITGAPTTLGYGALFGIAATGPLPTEVMVLGLGSMTHSLDSNQRAIELPMGTIPGTDGAPTLVVAGSPADTHAAPPGYYLLVVLDADRTPSAARIVHLT